MTDASLTLPDAERAALADRLASVRERIEQAARSAGRSAESLTLIAVTKFHPAALAAELVRLGVTHLGENRHQEAAAKSAALAEVGIAPTWHFLGQLQTNKARHVARYAGMVHTVDRAELVQALSRLEQPLDCLLQVNLTDDEHRGGVAPNGIESLTEQILAAPGLRLRGMMAVAPLPQEEAPEAAFARLADYAARLRSLAPDATILSAGMSLDLEAAVAAGATHLRIGTAITGNRPTQG